MNKLSIYNSDCRSIFRLIGDNENALTFSFGYILSKQPDLLILFLKELGILKRVKGKNYEKLYSNYSVHLQKYNDDKSGIMDIVIEDNLNRVFRYVIEAKTDNSFPSKTQLNKYVSKEKNKDWMDYQNKSIISITVKDFSKYKPSTNPVKNVSFVYTTWSQLLRLLIGYQVKQEQRNLLVDELMQFLMTDFKIKYFEKEVITITVLKNYHNMVCMGLSGKGFYFNSSRTVPFPSGLFFVPCYGKYEKQALWLRRIQEYSIRSAAEIQASADSELKQGFHEHLQHFPNDTSANEIHYFVLTHKISIPARNSKFRASNFDYSKSITDFLS